MGRSIRNARGMKLAWMKAHIDYAGSDCLVGPFPRKSNGYCDVFLDGKNRRANRVMCQYRNGPPPTPSHDAAHTCGKGHLGCLNPNHLVWKTRAENNADRIIHGTDDRGEKSPFAKLTAGDVLDIRATQGLSHRKLAAQYGVSHYTIGQVMRRQRWAWLTDEASVSHG